MMPGVMFSYVGDRRVGYAMGSARLHQNGRYHSIFTPG